MSDLFSAAIKTIRYSRNTEKRFKKSEKNTDQQKDKLNMVIIKKKALNSPSLLLFTLFFCFTVSAFEYDTISGPLPKTVLAGEKPYLVASDIEVPFGKTVTIEPGTILLFQNFTGFQVQGQLIAEGTKEKPIVFTSEFDGRFNPDTSLIANPFDWNGIYIHKDAFGTRFKYCKINYSVYGIASDTRLIRIDPGLFYANGKAHLTIADSMHLVEDEKPYTYVLNTRDAKREGVSIKLVRRFFPSSIIFPETSNAYT